MADEREQAIAKATFTIDQVSSLIFEMEQRVPNALHAMANRIMDPTPPVMSRGEWEIVRKLALLGWSSHSLSILTADSERE